MNIMNFSIKKSAAIIAALAMATTGALAINSTKADAVAVATVKSSVTARLYTSDGQLITNRSLAPNTPWLVDKITMLDGDTYYQVATNEYLKSTDSTLAGYDNPVGTIVNGDAPFYYTMTKGDAPTARTLSNGTQWQVEYAVRDINGNVYYSVAPNEWISSKNMTVNKDVKTDDINSAFGGNLGVTGTNTNTSTNTNTNPSTNTNTDVVASTTATVTNGDAPVYYTMTKGDPAKSKTIASGTTLTIDSEIKDKNGDTYYSFAPNEWISGKHITLDKAVKVYNNDDNFTDRADFGIDSNGTFQRGIPNM